MVDEVPKTSEWTSLVVLTRKDRRLVFGGGPLAPWVTRLSGHIARMIAKLETDVDRIEKREFVADLSTVFAETSMVVVTRNEGMTVADVTDLRRKMRAAGASFKVAKNRLALLALDGTRFDGLKPLMKGPTAISWSKDPVAVAKAAVDFAKTNDKFVLIGGSLGTQVLDVSGVKALAELPSLDTLRAKFLGLLNTPATRIAGVVQAPAGQLARVFAAYADSKGEAA